MGIPPKIVLGLPTFGQVSMDWSESRSAIQWPLGSGVTTCKIEGQKIDVARDAIAQYALDVDATYTLFLADDVIPPPNIVLQLLSRDVDIVTGIYWTKSFPKEPYIWRGIQQGPFTQWKHGEFFEIDMAGCDALLVKTDVFRKLPKPWFSCNWTWKPDTIPGSLTTEDFHFYIKAKEAGYKVWADTTVQCGHEDRNSKTVFWLTDDMPQVRSDVKTGEDIVETEELCADIGSGDHSKYWHGKLMRYDIDETSNPDILCDARQIPEPDEKFDEVRTSHLLEHFPAHEAPALVTEWLRILKVGGMLRISVPNLEWAMRVLLAKHDGKEEALQKEDILYAWGVIYGSADSEFEHNSYMEHRNGFTDRHLPRLLEQVGGVTDIVVETTENGACLMVTAKKTHTPKPAVLLKMWDKVVDEGRVAGQRKPKSEPTLGPQPWQVDTPEPEEQAENEHEPVTQEDTEGDTA